MEIFFKILKQNFKIKILVGTSQNALFIQIPRALITILLLKYPCRRATHRQIQFQSTLAWSLSALVALLRYHLFAYRDLWS